MLWIGLIALALVLIFLRQSLPVVLMCCAIYVQLVWAGGNPTYVVEDMWNALDNTVLLSIPMFLLAGAIMARGAIAQRLIDVVRAFTKPLRGGLAVATIISCATFAAIAGSSAVTMLAIGTFLYPALLQQGYTKEFSLGALCSAGTLGIIIPPSIPLIIYGIVNEMSIIDLFIAGIIPGLFLTFLLSAYSVYVNRHLPREQFDAGEVLTALRRGIWAILLPVILLGGIYSGYFSPTESAATAVAYAIVVELLIHREMSIKNLAKVIVETAAMLGTLILLIAVIISLQGVLTLMGVQAALADWVVEVFQSKLAFLIAVNILLLIVGCFLDAVSAILVLSPLLLPTAVALGVNPVHFGIIMVVNLEIGLLTPPVGLNLIVALTAFKEKFSIIVKGTLPFVALMIVALIIITFTPWISLALL